MAYWLFQGNPKYYRIIDAIRDFVQMPGLVTRYGKDMAVGDGVLIWKAGQDAGIYAIAEIIEPPKMLDKVPVGIGLARLVWEASRNVSTNSVSIPPDMI